MYNVAKESSDYMKPWRKALQNRDRNSGLRGETCMVRERVVQQNTMESAKSERIQEWWETIRRRNVLTSLRNFEKRERYTLTSKAPQDPSQLPLPLPSPSSI